MTAATSTSVQYLNLAYFGRPADPASLDAFPAAGMTDSEIVAAFVKTSEYTAGTITPNSSANPAGGVTYNETALINTLYNRLFGRNAAAVEITGWSTALKNGTVNHDYLGITIVNAALNLPASTEMRQVMVAKHASAQLWSSNLSSNAANNAAYTTSAAAAKGVTFLSGITTTTAATQAATDAAVADMAATSFTGDTILFTSSVDVLVGGAKNDKFIAVNEASAAAGDTFSVADTVDGGAGIDTLEITDTQGGALGGLTVTNVENVTLRGLQEDDTAETFNQATMSGATAYTFKDFTDGITVTNADLGDTFALNSFAVDHANDDVTITYRLATGSSDSASISTSGSTLQQVVVDAIETLSVSNSGTSVTSIARLDAAQATTINIDNSTATVGTTPGLTITAVGDNTATAMTFTGSGSTTATGALSTGLLTLTGSAATGDLDLNVSSNANNLTLTTGSGNDRVEAGTVGTNLTADDSWNLGSGTNTLVIDDTSLTAQDILDINAVTGITNLELSTTTAESAYDGKDIGIDSFIFAGAITDAAGADGGAGAEAGDAGTAGTAANNQALSLTGVEAGDVFKIKENITGGEGGNGGAGTEGTGAGPAGGAGANGSVALLLTEELSGAGNTATLILDGATITGGAGGNGGAGADGEGANKNGGAGGAAGSGAIAISATTFETLNIQSITAANAVAGGAAGTAGEGGAKTGTGTAGSDGAAGSAGASVAMNTNGTINVTGDKNLDLGTVSGTDVTINASSFTGILTVTGEAGNNIITGGSKADVINGGAGQDTLTGGAGADDFTFTAGANVTGGTPSASVFDIITDFNTGSDEIDFSAALTVETATATAAVGTASINSEGFASFHSADDTLAEKITAVEAGIVTGTESSGDFALFTHGSDTYLFIHDGTSGLANTDALIQLKGVTGLSNTTLVSGDLFIS